MKIQSVYLGGEYLSHIVASSEATYLLVDTGRIVYAGATRNLLMRLYKHLSRGLIPRDKRGNWMIYYWDIQDAGLEAIYIRFLRPAANQNGRQTLTLHDYSDWVEAACEAYFLRKPLCLVRSLVKNQADIKSIWEATLSIERDYLWLSSTFPWHDAALAKWQRVVNQVQLTIRRGATTDDLLMILTKAIGEPPKIPPLELNKARPSVMGRPPKKATSSLIT